MRKITFSYHRPGGDRRHFVSEDDVRIVLERLPSSVWQRLRSVHFNDRALCWHCLGYVTRGRDAISLCALPPRVSLGASLQRSQSPAQFGAILGCQWPWVAVRRLMLYQVLLHEIGHLQIVADHRPKSSRRRFARETLAQRFAEHWRRQLWSQPFDHPDPVHNPPTLSEHRALPDDRAQANSH